MSRPGDGRTQARVSVAVRLGPGVPVTRRARSCGSACRRPPPRRTGGGSPSNRRPAGRGCTVRLRWPVETSRQSIAVPAPPASHPGRRPAAVAASSACPDSGEVPGRVAPSGENCPPRHHGPVCTRRRTSGGGGGLPGAGSDRGRGTRDDADADSTATLTHSATPTGPTRPDCCSACLSRLLERTGGARRPPGRRRARPRTAAEP